MTTALIAALWLISLAGAVMAGVRYERRRITRMTPTPFTLALSIARREFRHTQFSRN